MTKQENTTEFQSLLEYLKHSRGFDFTGYKVPSLTRRIRRRMQEVHIDDYAAYIDHLEMHPNEFVLLFNTILINVTTFFRDEKAWSALATTVIPEILANKRNGAPIRIWSAGCASGEEPYSLAILFAEAMGMEDFRERVKIFASDVDEEALDQARKATYGSRQVGSVPESLLARYFERVGTHFTIHKDLRRAAIFGRLDLVQDAPISRLDLLVCRNLLMYFNAETQTRILSRFHFALNDTGFLFLGKAEMLFTQSQYFKPINLNQRIFVKVPQITLRDRLLSMNQTMNEDPPQPWTQRARFREIAFDASPYAQLVVDANGYLVMANDRARSLLRLNVEDVNRSLQELELSYQLPELRAHIRQVQTERRPLQTSDVEWETSSGEVRQLEVSFMPMFDGVSETLGVSVIFSDVTRYKQLQNEVEHANQELETAYEELQSTNEELETTNEELQSAVEELETTNEELQSTNEELETMNEGLQSTNEELEAMNDELRQRTDEINYINSFLDSILTSMRGGVVVVDTDLRIKIWSQKAEELWGLRADEVMDRNLLNLEIGLQVSELREPVRGCLTPPHDHHYCELILDATNRRGKKIRCKVTCTPLLSPIGKQVEGVTLIMEEIEGSS